MSVLGKRKIHEELMTDPQTPKRMKDNEVSFQYISSEDDDLKSEQMFSFMMCVLCMINYIVILALYLTSLYCFIYCI